ncbi:hypothetical protein [Microbacterium sp. 18062]|uniref:hypothetical protein n=1 Tax=Microbacterium sp. 18062 TaxID=2681410 RepID=UPI0013567F89|nr:hypothetical protein [Microbacterium sp. 18062]
MKARRLLATASLVMAIALITVSAPTAATAAPQTDETRTEQRACTVGTVPQRGEPDPDVPVVVSCFDTLTEAETFVEEGAPGDLEQLTPQARTDVTAASTVIVGRQYTGTGRTGSVLVQWGTGSGCYGVTYGFPSMPSGWNDVIRSSEGFNNCWVSDYANTSYGGAVYNCTPYCSSLGTMAAQTSSVVYRPSGSLG